MNCITFENDQHTVEPGQKAQKGGAQELWSNPNYFMEVKKGASEDHAILLADATDQRQQTHCQIQRSYNVIYRDEYNVP